MNRVNAVERRNAFGLHAGLLDVANQVMPLGRRVAVARRIQHAANLGNRKGRIEPDRIEAMGFFCPVILPDTQHVQGQLGHFSHLVLQSHARQNAFHSRGRPVGAQLRIRNPLMWRVHLTRLQPQHQNQRTSNDKVAAHARRDLVEKGNHLNH